MGTRRPLGGLLIVGAILAVAGFLGVSKILTSGLGGIKRGEQAVPVALVTVGPVTFTDIIEAIGTARSNEAVTITAKVTETVRRVAFTDGQTVQAGDILVELTNDEEAASLQSARTSLEEAQNNLDRITTLAGTGVASKAQLDTARSVRDAAQGKVDTVVAQLSDRLIRAPFAGVLGLRNVSAGSLVRPGDVITTLDDVSIMKLDFVLPESYLSTLSVGLTIQAKAAAYPDRQYSGTIQAIDSRVDPVTRGVTVRATVPNTDGTMRSGMLMTLGIIKSMKSAPAVPERAIVALSNDLYVYKIDGGKAVRVKVTTGAHQDGFVEITSGLTGGEKIVSDGVHRLRPGQKVEIVESDGTEMPPSKTRPQS